MRVRSNPIVLGAAIAVWVASLVAVAPVAEAGHGARYIARFRFSIGSLFHRKRHRHVRRRRAYRVRHAPSRPDPEIVRIQRALNRLGFDAGVADGINGKRTRGAVAEFQRSLGQPANGTLSLAQKAALLQGAGAREAAPQAAGGKALPASEYGAR